MQCIRPIKASFNSTGDVVYSSKSALPGLVPFEFPCRKCLPCRLNIAREKAVRCMHEAKMHENNIFLTLTYDDEHLPKNGRLNYLDFQLFMKSLREKQSRGLSKEAADLVYIPYMVTGEYGEKSKRPHWHAILFNYRPTDAKFKYSTERGDKVYTSEELEKLWKRGHLDFGAVTLDSAGYVARYAAKKLVHGKDDEHDYHPIHKTSSRRAIGRSWIEKYYKYTFENGFCVLPDGSQVKIPRYYVDWFKKNHPQKYLDYMANVQHDMVIKSEKKRRREEAEYITNLMSYKGGAAAPLTRPQVKNKILQRKFKRLQEMLKL